MNGINGERVPWLLGSIPTAEKRISAFLAKIDWGKVRNHKRTQKREIPPLDVPLLQAKYSPERAHWPRTLVGTFRVPLDISRRDYAALRLAYVKKFVEAMEKQNWELYPDAGIQVYPGVYPAYDLRDKTALLDQREMHIRAKFRCKKPELVQIELPD